MSDSVVCPCGVPTRDGAYVCETCLDGLAAIIGSIPAIEAELEAELVGERSKPLGAGSRSSVPPMPYNTKASELLTELRARTVALVRLCHVENVRHQSPDNGYPADTLPAMSTWLLWRTDGLAWVPWAWDTITTYQRLETRINAFLTPRKPKQYLGTCDIDFDGTPCGGSIYADHGSNVGKCDRADCRQTYAADAQRRTLEERLDSRLCTPAEIATLAVYLNLNTPRDTIRKRVHYWARHGRIMAANTTEQEDRRLYRYGEVKALLYREFAKDA